MPRGGMDEHSRLLVIDENETSSSSFAEDFESTTTSNHTRSSFYPSFINVSVLKSIAIATVSVAAFSLALLKASSTASVGGKELAKLQPLGTLRFSALGLTPPPIDVVFGHHRNEKHVTPGTEKNADAFDHVERTGRVEIVDDRAKRVRGEHRRSIDWSADVFRRDHAERVWR